MDKYKRIQLVCWIIVLVVFIGLAIWFLRGTNLMSFRGGFRLQNLSGPFEEVGRYSVDQSDIGSISIDWTAGDITVSPYDGNKIEIVEYAQRELEEDEVLTYKTSGDTLSIKFRESYPVFDYMPAKKLEVLVPSELAADLNDFIVDNVSSGIVIKGISAGLFQIDSVSGKGNFTDIKADEIKIDTTSGSINITYAEAPVISLHSISGRITADSLTTNDLTADTTSGGIKMEETTTEELSFDTISGDVNFYGSFKNLDADSTSGKYDITNEEVPDGFDIDTVSGSIDITMPAIEGLDIKFDSVSGDLSSDIPVSYNSKGSDKYYINTISGNADIHELQ